MSNAQAIIAILKVAQGPVSLDLMSAALEAAGAADFGADLEYLIDVGAVVDCYDAVAHTQAVALA